MTTPIGEAADSWLDTVRAGLRRVEEETKDWPLCERGCGARRDPAGPAVCPRCASEHVALREQREARLAEAQIPAKFRWAKFGDPALLSARVKDADAKAAAMDWHSGRLVLSGPAGAGKTVLACTLLRRHVLGTPEGRSGLFVDTFSLAMARRLSPLGKEAELVAHAMRTSLLVLDDLGSDPHDPLCTVAHVVHEREQQERDTIVTTWLTPEAVAKTYGHGMARRVYDGSTVVEVRRLP